LLPGRPGSGRKSQRGRGPRHESRRGAGENADYRRLIVRTGSVILVVRLLLLVVTILAGPLNCVGVNPKAACR